MRRIAATLLVVLLPHLAIAPAAVARSNDVKLGLVAYSTPREAYAKLIQLFQKTPAGKDVSFSQSYGSSGEQARAVKAGLRSDVVALSLAPDIDELVRAGLVDASWSKQSYRGMVTNSVVVFVVRDGNPKQIKTWNDLLKPGIEVITPNPFTSGRARWNVMAAYGASLQQGKTPKQAQGNLLRLFRNVAVQDKSARDSLNTFVSGKGDVLLAYENEALFSRSKGQDLQFIISRQTLLIENPIAVLKESANKEVSNAFLRFLRTPEAQRVFATDGYRPLDKGVAAESKAKFPSRPGLFTIEQRGLGGWSSVTKRFFDPRDGIMAAIERQVGGVTG